MIQSDDPVTTYLCPICNSELQLDGDRVFDKITVDECPGCGDPIEAYLKETTESQSEPEK